MRQSLLTLHSFAVCFQNIKKFPLIVTHLNYQEESIENSLSELHRLKTHINDLQVL